MAEPPASFGPGRKRTIRRTTTRKKKTQETEGNDI